AKPDSKDRENRQRKRHHTRAFMRMSVSRSAPAPKEDIGHLPRHVESRQQRANQQKHKGALGHGPRMGRAEDRVLTPETGKEDWKAAQRQHTNRICPESNRHDFREAAHAANILLFVAAMD